MLVSAASERFTFDTSPLRGSEAFEFWARKQHDAANPWTIDYQGGPFRARIEAIHVENGTVVRSMCTSNLTGQRTRKDISHSESEFYWLSMIIDGSTARAQGDAAGVFGPGDVVVLSGQKPLIGIPASSRPVRALTFMIPIERLAGVPDLEKLCRSLVLSKTNRNQPLSSCLWSLAQDLDTYSVREVNALFDASVNLAKAQCLGREPSSAPIAAGRRMGELIQLVQHHLADSSLSARQLALGLGVSETRTHQMFAAMGTTFSSYVSDRRVRQAAADLRGSPDEYPIERIAFRWGFSDMQTFRRAFRKVFGCTPTEFRRIRR